MNVAQDARKLTTVLTMAWCIRMAMSGQNRTIRVSTVLVLIIKLSAVLRHAVKLTVKKYSYLSST